MPGRVVWIEGAGGTPLCADLYLPAGEGPFAPLLEALPYRKDDVTASYRESYERLVGAGFAVCRVDLRGTGSSGGVATDEYPDVERADLRAVIAWLAGQPWSTGRVGMFGTSYSGFNALHMAAEGVPELGAVVAAYATDDRYTDDVHYCGGVLRAVDLIDYVLYMVAMNALPPVPALWGDGWRDEWRRRIDETPPWLFEWLRRSGRRPDVASRFDPARPRRRRLRADLLPDDARRRMGRRVPQQHVPHRRARDGTVAAARRSVEPSRSGALPTRAEHRRRRRDHRLLRRAPARRNAIGGAPRPRCSCAVRHRRSPISSCTTGCGATSRAGRHQGSAGGCCHPRVTASTPSRSRATSAWRRGSRAPERCHGASHRTSASTTPGR